MKNWENLLNNTETLLQGENKTQGRVVKISDGVVTISGLQGATAGEMLKVSIEEGGASFSNFVYAMVLNLGTDSVEAIVLGDENKVKEESAVQLCDFSIQIPVHFSLLGRVIDPLGNPIDGKGAIESKVFKKVDIKAPGIIQRESVTEAMETGVKAIDSMVPIGRGQRELIIGDRQTGKTAVALDTIIHQRPTKFKLPAKVVHPSDLQAEVTQKQQLKFLQDMLILNGDFAK